MPQAADSIISVSGQADGREHPAPRLQRTNPELGLMHPWLTSLGPLLPRPPTTPRFIATLNLGTYPNGPWTGQAYTFDSTGASGSTVLNMGNYTPQTHGGISDNITQQCFRVTRPDINVFIDFRPDSPDSGRSEFVVTNGLCNTVNSTRQAAINAAAANVGAFQLTVTRNFVQIFQGQFPQLG